MKGTEVVKGTTWNLDSVEQVVFERLKVDKVERVI